MAVKVPSNQSAQKLPNSEILANGQLHFNTQGQALRLAFFVDQLTSPVNDVNESSDFPVPPISTCVIRDEPD